MFSHAPVRQQVWMQQHGYTAKHSLNSPAHYSFQRWHNPSGLNCREIRSPTRKTTTVRCSYQNPPQNNSTTSLETNSGYPKPTFGWKASTWLRVKLEEWKAFWPQTVQLLPKLTFPTSSDISWMTLTVVVSTVLLMMVVKGIDGVFALLVKLAKRYCA